MSYKLPQKRSTRVILALGGTIVLFNAAVFFLNRAIGGPSGPSSSSYATAPEGVKAYATLLTEAGHPVARLRSPLDEGPGPLPPGATLIFLDPGVVDEGESAALARFVDSGGRLVVSLRAPADWLDEIIEDPPEWSSGGPRRSIPLVPVIEVAGVKTVALAGTGSWPDAHSSLPVVGDTGAAVVTVAQAGRGRVVLMADASPLQNRLLAAEDNAALGLGIAGEAGHPVFFAESHHGYGQASGLGALPESWRWSLIGLALAALALIVARGRRLGPPEQVARMLPPPRRAYIDAVAAILARTQTPEVAIAPVQEAARAEVLRRAGLRGEATDDVKRAAESLGLPEGQVRALIEPVHGDTDIVTIGRTLADVKRRTT